MKRPATVFSLLTLLCSFVLLTVLAAEVSAAETAETVYATTYVNVRTGPGTKYAILDVLPQGGSAQRTETSNGWSKVVWGDSEGYVRSRYLSGTQPSGSGHAENQLHASYDDASVSFHPEDRTVYAISDVNVRVGPGTEYQSMGCCASGESIQCTGTGENGWSRVIYKGDVAYIRTRYLSDSRAEIQSSVVSNMKVYGHLTIPFVGVDVNLYSCPSGSENAQAVVDAVNSAAYMEQASVDGAIIADHKHQGFDAIRMCEPYITRAYIDFGTYTQEYICTAIGKGENSGTDLRDWNGNSLNYKSIPGGLAMYTCNDNWQDITITYWERA